MQHSSDETKLKISKTLGKMNLKQVRARWTGLLMFIGACLVYMNVQIYLSSLQVLQHKEQSLQMLRMKDNNDANTLKFYKMDSDAIELNLKNHLNVDLYTENDGCDFSSLIHNFMPLELDIHCGNIHELEIGQKLGEGFWRAVYKAQWKDQTFAVKIVHDEHLTQDGIIERHAQEAALLFQLRNEPNIVHLRGWCNATTVVEYVPNPLDALVYNNATELSVHRSLYLALDAAKGVDQLHRVLGGPIAHTDLQPRQFLINDKGRLLLNDFNRMKYVGLSQPPYGDFERCNYHTPVAKGKYRSPEEYLDLALDEKVDIYSLGVVLWSLRSREPPFEQYSRSQVYKYVPSKALRPNSSLMLDYPIAMQNLIKDMWKESPVFRPSASDIVYRIQEIIVDYENEMELNPLSYNIS